jgi:hypothetical protein
MNITTSEISALENCKSEKEWDQICDQIKADRSGNYPPDWYDKVMLSGLMSRVSSRF